MGALIKVLDETRTRTCSVVLQQHLVSFDDPGGGYCLLLKRRFKNENAARRAFEAARVSSKRGAEAENDVIAEADEE